MPLSEQLTPQPEQNLNALRHTAAHILAQAVKRLFPDVKLAIGPTIEDGFYYDFDLGKSLAPEDLVLIEQEMQVIIKNDYPLSAKVLLPAEAESLLGNQGEKYKLELIADLAASEYSFYTQGEFTDLCRGPHVASTGQVKAIKLLKIAGAYWRGSEKNQMLQRIYGTAWESQTDLDNYLNRIAEAEKRDHRRLGPELDLFHIDELAGPGLIYYHPKGAALRKVIEDYMYQQNLERGYQPVIIPHLAKQNLWQTSGHYDYYRENMYFSSIDEQEYVIKPMNCPGHILIYKQKIRSYRELPVRYFEFGTVYRYERSGVLHGLLRVRGFTQDDGHIFCRFDQVKQEVTDALDFVDTAMKKFGFSYDVFVSTRPESFAGLVENWDAATAILQTALQEKGIKFEIDPGAGVFYGPKIDIKLRDALGRVWQGPTIQVDFNLPERFKIEYVDSDGARKQPVMIHRAILGSFERFIGALIEHYAGAFPFWLAPVQVRLLAISEQQLDYVNQVTTQLRKAGMRVETDVRNEKIGLKIREAQMQKIPYMLVIGKKEVAEGMVAVRSREAGDLGVRTVSDFISLATQTEQPITNNKL